MSKILTDEIIDRYNQGESLDAILQDYEVRTGKTVVIDELDIEQLSKSRRIENVRKEMLRRKLNMILGIILLLLFLLIYAIFNW